MASLYDVAARAGVSKTLVSRVINNQKGVSEASRKKIAEAMKELHYKPNALARSLVLQKTRTVGVVLDTLCEPFYFELIRGIEEEITEKEYNVVFSEGRNRIDIKNRYIDYFMRGRTDGIIIYGSSLDDEGLIRQLVECEFPFVVVENNIQDLDISAVLVDNRLGSELAAKHLAQAGCRRVGHITGEQSVKASLERTEGFLSAVHSLGLVSDIVLQADFTEKSGYLVIKNFLEEYGRDKLPEAFYCGCDNTAYGAMKALREAGVHIPEDILMVGFDNDSKKENRKEEGLTTLAQPMYEMGRAAVKLLLDRVEQNCRPQKVIFAPELVVGRTTVRL